MFKSHASIFSTTVGQRCLVQSVPNVLAEQAEQQQQEACSRQDPGGPKRLRATSHQHQQQQPSAPPPPSRRQEAPAPAPAAPCSQPELSALAADPIEESSLAGAAPPTRPLAQTPAAPGALYRAARRSPAAAAPRRLSTSSPAARGATGPSPTPPRRGAAPGDAAQRGLLGGGAASLAKGAEENPGGGGALQISGVLFAAAVVAQPLGSSSPRPAGNPAPIEGDSGGGGGSVTNSGSGVAAAAAAVAAVYQVGMHLEAGAEGGPSKCRTAANAGC